MTTREELRSRGFDFFCFTTAEDRTAFRARHTETFEFAEVDRSSTSTFSVSSVYTTHL